MPNGEAQQTLIEEVCSKYGVAPNKVDYVECHGTGTAIGDPTECGAVGATYGRNRADPVVVVQSRATSDTWEAAAGVAGVIKAVLTVMHREATPLGNLKEPNPAIPFEELGIRLADESIPLGKDGEPIHVAVNSFGYGGSNAHAILASSPISPLLEFDAGKPGAGKSDLDEAESSGHVDRQETRAGTEMPFVFPVSGRSKEAVQSVATASADWMESTNATLRDLSYSATQRRAHLSQRAVAMGHSREEVIAALRMIGAGEDHGTVVRDTQPFQGLRKPVFVFTGMGPQWWAMGQELYKSQPLYRESIRKADTIFEEIAGFSILAEMLKSEEESQIKKTEFAQPANFLIQIGVLELLRSLGVHPGLVVGHSVGEVGSAYAAGVLSLEDALLVSFHRSRLQAETAGQGGMLAVGLGKADALDRVSDCQKLVSLAAVNSPSTVTLAGYIPSLERIAAELTAEGIFAQMLDVEIPYHSPVMDQLLPRLERELANVQTNAPSLPLYSTVTGGPVTTASFGAEYWPLNVRQPVEFEAAIRGILEEGYNTFVEIGPHPVLSSSLRDCVQVEGKDCRFIHTLRRSLPNESQCIHRAAMAVYAAGCDVDWTVLAQGQFVPLPNYAWQREYYWSEFDRAAQDRLNPLVHPILGTQEALSASVWRNDFDHQPVLYLRDHVVSQVPILPAAAYLESLLELAEIQFPGSEVFAVRDMEIIAPMIITPDRGLDFTTTYDTKNQTAAIRSLENGRLGIGQVHVTAQISGGKAVLSEQDETQPQSVSLEQLRARHQTTVDVPSFYADLNKIGLSYGPKFQTVHELFLSGDSSSALARLELDAELLDDLGKYQLHPTMLDGCFQVLMAMLDSGGTTYLPTHLTELCLYAKSAPNRIWCVGRLVSRNARKLECDLTLVDDDGDVVATIRGLRATAAGKPERTDKYGEKVKRQILNYRWEYGESLAEPKRLGHWLCVGDAGETSEFAMGQIENYGARVVGRVRFDDEFSQHDSEYSVRIGSQEDAQSVLDSCGGLDGIAFFVALDETLSEGSPTGEKALNALLVFAKAMLAIPVDERPRVYVVTRAAFPAEETDDEFDPAGAAINGFVRVASNELDGFRFTTIDLPIEDSDDSFEALALELVCDAEEDEVAIRNDARLVSELMETDILTNDIVVPTMLDDENPVQIRPLRKDVEGVGVVRVIASPAVKPGANDVLVRVESTLLPANLIADQSSEQIDQPCVEIVGRIVEVGANVTQFEVGTRVCGFAPPDVISHLCGDQSQFHLVPIAEHADASRLVAGIMLPTCARRAVESHELEVGQCALVHDSPMGRAVAQELFERGLHITLLSDDVANVEEEIGSKYAVYPASPSSIDRVITEQTNGQRFSVLVAGMGTWGKDFGFRMLRNASSVIDTDMTSGPLQLSESVSAVSRASTSTLLNQPKKLREALASVVEGLIKDELEPQPSLTVSVADIAWQNLAMGDTTIRIVMDYDTRDRDLPVVQVDHLEFHADATYLVTGGFGGFGQKTALWLVEHGAKTVVLTGRSGANTPDKYEFMQELERLGANVVPAACDTSDFDSLSNLFDEIARTLPPIKGIFHSGAVILDQAVSEADLETFNKVMRSKATGAWNLHKLTESMDLDHFVLYSSLANLIGNSRQSAYCAANGFLNGLARKRVANGLPATTVNWGAIDDVGVVAQDEKLEQFLRHVGLRGLHSKEGLELLHLALARKITQFGVVVIKSWGDWARFETIGSSSTRFATLVEADSSPKDSGVRQQLIAEMACQPPADRVELMTGLVTEVVASVLKANTENIAADRPINELGIDSLMAAEIQILFESQLGISISVLELLGDTTIRSLASSLVESLQDELDTFSSHAKAPAEEAVGPEPAMSAD